jgi:hypothetical protein
MDSAGLKYRGFGAPVDEGDDVISRCHDGGMERVLQWT